jgi:PAS domain S-box-containing protein
MNPFHALFGSDNFMPHGHCYYWDPTILWSHALSDGIIAVAYFLIPVVLIKVFQKRKNTQYVWLMALFAVFIAGCGLTHVMDVVTIWDPVYRLDSAFRSITAVASIGTAIALVKLAPRLLAIPTASEWQLAATRLDAANQELLAANQALKDLTDELSERKHFIEQVLALIPNSIYILDLDPFRTTYINREITHALGYTEEQIYSYGPTMMSQLLHPDDLKNRAQYYLDFATATEGEVRQAEVRIRHADGHYRHFMVRNVVFHWKTDGTVDQILGIALDITDQKRLADRLQEFNKDLKEKSDELAAANDKLQAANETLAERNYFIEQVLSLTPNSIYIFDLNQFRTIYVNREIIHTLGYTQEQVYSFGNTIMKQLIHPDDFEKRSRYYIDFSTAADGEVREVDFRIRNVHGNYRHFLVRSVVFRRNAGDMPEQILGISLDITEQQRLAVKLQESNIYLQEKTHELATANEELQAANEELIAANEKLVTVSDYLKAANLENERLAAETLRISEQRYLELTDNMKEIFVVLNHEMRYTFANKAAEQFFGQSRENLYGKTPREVFGPETGPVIEAVHRQVMETGESQTDVEQHVIDGRPAYLERTVYPTSVGGVFVIRRNVTAGMLAEQRFRDLAESITDIFFALDHEFRYTYFNRASEQFTNRRASEVLGKPIYDILPSFRGSILEKAFLQVLQTRQPDSLLYQYTHHTQEYYFMLHIYVTETGIAIIGRNETERIRLTQNLEEEKQRLELALRNGELGLWDWELTTNQVYLNEQWALMLDYEPHEVTHNISNWLEKIHPEDMQRVTQLLESHLQNQSPLYQAEYRLKSKHGEWKWILDSGKVISRDEQGKALRVTGIVMDITKKKQYEDKINRLNEELETKVQERTAQLTAVNDELEAFSYAVSHDLQAPLRSIGGFSKVLMEDYYTVLDTNGKENLVIIQQATQRMRDIIQALLKLSKVTRMPLHKEPVDVSQLARQILAELQKTDKGRHVVCQVADEVTAHADASLFRIVLQNLLGNAWKYTGKKKDGKIMLGKTMTPHGEAFFVWDNGAGFDMKYAKKLFNAFQRLHPEKDFEGTGIGLATVYRIITKHGGQIWAESAPDEGATFYFTLNSQ